MDFEKMNREFEMLTDEFSRMKGQYDEAKKVMNVSDAEILETMNDIKNGNVPEELQEALLAANAAAKEAGNVRSMRAKPASSGGSPKPSRRQGVIRLN